MSQQIEQKESVEDLYNKFMAKVSRQKSGSRPNLPKSPVSTVRHERQFSFQKTQNTENNLQNQDFTLNKRNSEQYTMRTNNFDLSPNNLFNQQFSQYSPSINKSFDKVVNTASFSPIRHPSLSPNSKFNKNHYISTNRSFTSGGQFAQQQQLINNMSQVSMTSQGGSSRAYSNALQALQQKIKEVEREKEDDKLKSIDALQACEIELEQSKFAYEEELNTIKSAEYSLKGKVENLEKMVEGISQENKQLIHENSVQEQQLKTWQQKVQQYEEKLKQQERKYEKQIDLLQEEINYMKKWKEEQKNLHGDLMKEREATMIENSDILVKFQLKKEQLDNVQSDLDQKNNQIDELENELSQERIKQDFLNKELTDMRAEYNKQLQEFQSELQNIENQHKLKVNDLENEQDKLIQENKKGIDLLRRQEAEYDHQSNLYNQKIAQQKQKITTLKKQISMLKLQSTASTTANPIIYVENNKKSSSNLQNTQSLNSSSRKKSSITPIKKRSDRSMGPSIQQQKSLKKRKEQQQLQYQSQNINNTTQPTESDDFSQINLQNSKRQVYTNFQGKRSSNSKQKNMDSSLCTQSIEERIQQIPQQQIQYYLKQQQQQQQQQNQFLDSSQQIISTVSNNNQNHIQQYLLQQQQQQQANNQQSQDQRHLLNDIVENINQDRQNNLNQEKNLLSKSQNLGESIKKQMLENEKQQILHQQRQKSYSQEKIQQTLEQQFQQLQQRYQKQLLTSSNSNNNIQKQQQQQQQQQQNINLLLSDNNVSNNIIQQQIKSNIASPNIQNANNINLQQLQLQQKDLSLNDLNSFNVTPQQQNNNNIDLAQQLQQKQHDQQVEVILKLIIETEKNAVELNKNYSQLLTESQAIQDGKKKSEYRGRLIELNEQIKKNNDKLYVLKKKEHQLMGQQPSSNNLNLPLSQQQQQQQQISTKI